MGGVSDKDAIRVLYFPLCENMEEKVLVDDDNEPIVPDELQIDFSLYVPPLSDEHSLFALPIQRPWET